MPLPWLTASVAWTTVFHPLKCAPASVISTLPVSMTGVFARGGGADDKAPAPSFVSLLVSTTDPTPVDSFAAFLCYPVDFSALFEDAVIGVFARCSGRETRPELTLLCVYFLRTPTPTLAIAYPSRACL